MRVALNGRFVGARMDGVTRVAREIAARLPSRVDCTLLVPRGRGPDPAWGGSSIVEGSLPGRAWEQLELPVAASGAGIDVLLHLANSAPRFGGPHVLLLHDVTPRTRPADFTLPYRLWSHWAHMGAARAAAAVMTVSEHSALEIARELSIPRDRITVVRQGVGPLDAPASEQDVDEVRARYGLPERYFLTVGTRDPRKGLHFLSRAFERWQQLDRAHSEVGLVVVGGRAEHVHRWLPSGPAGVALGQVDDRVLRGLYTGSVALLHAAEEEGFGRVPLEAMACGTRALTARYPCASEVLGPEAELIPLDAEAWGRAMSGVLGEDAATRDRKIETGRAWCRRYSWEVAADTVVEVCRRVVGATRGVPARRGSR